jgi:hypothetical protein
MPPRDEHPTGGAGPVGSMPAGVTLPSSRPSRARPATWRSAAGRVVLGIVGVSCVTLAVVLTSALSFADEAGQPFGAPAVAITPTSGTPTTESTPAPPGVRTNGDPEVVDAPLPVTVDLDDGGDGGENGDNGRGKHGNGGGGGGGNSGGGGDLSDGGGTGLNGSGSSGSGSNGSGSNGSGSSGSGSNGSGSNGSGKVAGKG